MGKPSKQIGWSTESNLLWEILSKIVTLKNVISSTPTSLESSNDILKSISGYNPTVAQRLEHTSEGIINWVNI
jgi:hypothetical protein